MLKDIRLSKNMTQEELAYKVGVARKTIILYENGDRIPTIEIFNKLCDVLKLNKKQRIIFISNFAEK